MEPSSSATSSASCSSALIPLRPLAAGADANYRASGGAALIKPPEAKPKPKGSEASQPGADVEDKKDTFDQFYDEVKAIEKRDSTLTPAQQIDRLNRAGSTYFNLNPFDVLMLDPESTQADIKQKYRRMSILVHPDKNQHDKERSQMAFEAVNKAYKTLQNDEGYSRCQEIVTEAKERVDEMMKTKKKKQKKAGEPQVVPEDDHSAYKHAVYVQTCKLFADLERLRQDRATKDMHERKRKAEDEVAEKEKEVKDKEWKKNFEASRTDRVDSWRSFAGIGKPKKAKVSKKPLKGGLKPPKVKMEKR